MKNKDTDSEQRAPNDSLDQAKSDSGDQPVIIKAGKLDKNAQHGLDRRGFLKGSFFSGAGAAAVAGLGGCGAGGDDDGGRSDTTSTMGTDCTVSYHQSHASRVASAAFNPDGTRLISGSSDMSVKIWDTATGAPIHTCSGHTNSVICVAYGPLNDGFASGSSDRSVIVWSTSGSLVRTYTGHTGMVYAVAYSPDGTRIASGDTNGNVHIWDVATGTLAFALSPGSSIQSLAFSPDGSMIATASMADVRIWDINGNLLYTDTSHGGAVYSVVFSPDSAKVATLGANGMCRIWQPQSGNLLMTFACNVSNRLSGLAFSPSGSQIAAASTYSGTYFWDASYTAGETLTTSLFSAGIGSWVAFRPTTGNSFVTVANNNFTVIGEYSASDGSFQGYYSDPAAPAYSTSASCTTGSGSIFGCTCDSVCSCDTVCTCNSVCTCDTVGSCTCNSESSHYWYPN